MRNKLIALSLLGLALTLPIAQLLAQRGGRGGGGGGGGMQRGGGGGQRGGGGFGGGLPQQGSRGGENRGGDQRGGQDPRGGDGRGGQDPRGGQASRGDMSRDGQRGDSGMGPYGRPGNSGGDSVRRPGTNPPASNRPGNAGGVATRPGADTLPANRPIGGGTGTAARPGVPANSAGRVNNANVAGVRPGTNPGAAAAAGAYAARPYGTYHTTNVAVSNQATAVRSATAYPAYNPAMYAAHPNAWPATNLTGGSLYANPGYAALASQLRLPAQPIPYDYGNNVVAQSQAVYVNGDDVGSPQEYAAQASQIAMAGNAQSAKVSSWQPLGVFAMVEGDQTSSDDTFQLAVNADGLIRGNYQNLKDNSIVSLAGSVDPKTQRAAWTIGGDTSPVYEAGIANLLENETTMLIHTGDGLPRQFTLVRLQQPAQGN